MKTEEEKYQKKVNSTFSFNCEWSSGYNPTCLGSWDDNTAMIVQWSVRFKRHKTKLELSWEEMLLWSWICLRIKLLTVIIEDGRGIANRLSIHGFNTAFKYSTWIIK